MAHPEHQRSWALKNSKLRMWSLKWKIKALLGFVKYSSWNQPVTLQPRLNKSSAARKWHEGNEKKWRVIERDMRDRRDRCKSLVLLGTAILLHSFGSLGYKLIKWMWIWMIFSQGSSSCPIVLTCSYHLQRSETLRKRWHCMTLLCNKCANDHVHILSETSVSLAIWLKSDSASPTPIRLLLQLFPVHCVLPLLQLPTHPPSLL